MGYDTTSSEWKGKGTAKIKWPQRILIKRLKLKVISESSSVTTI